MVSVNFESINLPNSISSNPDARGAYSGQVSAGALSGGGHTMRGDSRAFYNQSKCFSICVWKNFERPSRQCTASNRSWLNCTQSSFKNPTQRDAILQLHTMHYSISDFRSMQNKFVFQRAVCQSASDDLLQTKRNLQVNTFWLGK